MNKADLEAYWGYLRMIFKNARKQVELIPADKLDFRPTPEVRSVGELCVHMHQYVVLAPQMVMEGKQDPSKDVEPKFTDKAELLKWMDAQVETGFATFHKLNDAQIAAVINAWGMDFPGWQLLSFVGDEIIHHRGQLTVYLRLMGIAPAFIYDFE